MKFTDNSYLGTPEVLKRKLGGELITPVSIDVSALSSEVDRIPAGTAVTVDGALSSGDGSDVYGITLNDCYPYDDPNVAVVRAYAAINTANTTATSADRAALPLITFE